MTNTIRPADVVQKELYQKQQEAAEFVKSKTTDDGSYDMDGDSIKALNDRNEEMDKLAAELEQAKRIEATVKAAQDATKSLKEVVRDLPFSGAGAEQYGHHAVKGIGDYFIESDAYKANREHHARGVEYAIEMDGSAVKAITTSSVLPYPAQQAGIVGYATRRPVVADLLPQTDTDQPSIVYLEQTTQTFGAATVAEGATKPESDFGWTRRTVPFEVIAHWTKITNQALEDVPGIRDRLNNEMTIGLQLAEETQLLSGTGTTPELQGFLTKSGVQTQAKSTDSTFGAYLKALTKVRFTGRANPSGSIFHPNDWEAILLTTDLQGRFIFGDPSAITQTRTLWGVPYVVTDAMTENTALIGDFQMYSRLWRKGGIRVLVGTEGDDLKKNLNTMVVEERAALEISRGAAFVKLTGI